MSWELSFLAALQECQTPLLNSIMAVLSHMGDGGILWIALGLILLIWPKTRRAGAEMLIAIAVTYVIGNLILKNAVGRARPYDVYQALEPLVTRPTDASFPSGHTMNGFTAATALFLNRKRAGIPALLLAGLIAFSRLYNLVHFPTDVLAGLVLGVGIACAVHYTANRMLRKRETDDPAAAQ